MRTASHGPGSRKRERSGACTAKAMSSAIGTKTPVNFDAIARPMSAPATIHQRVDAALPGVSPSARTIAKSVQASAVSNGASGVAITSPAAASGSTENASAV
jgi:hypothetical protein